MTILAELIIRSSYDGRLDFSKFTQDVAAALVEAQRMETAQEGSKAHAGERMAL